MSNYEREIIEEIIKVKLKLIKKYKMANYVIPYGYYLYGYYPAIMDENDIAGIIIDLENIIIKHG